MNWYILFVLGGSEKKVAAYLQEQGFHAFLPMMEVLYRKKGCFHIEKKLMFPGYIFVESTLPHNLFHEAMLAMKQRKSGIIKELRFDKYGTPALREAEREMIEQLLDEHGVMKHSIGWIQGDKVIITDGPLQGMESKIVHIDRHKRRAKLELSIMGQTVDLHVSLEIVKKIG